MDQGGVTRQGCRQLRCVNGGTICACGPTDATWAGAGRPRTRHRRRLRSWTDVVGLKTVTRVSNGRHGPRSGRRSTKATSSSDVGKVL